MQVRQAKEAARQWVMEEASRAPGFCGAFHHGSTNWLADEATLAPTSDVDVVVVVAGPKAAGKSGKFLYRGVLLDVSYIPRQRMESADAILGNYQLAGSFHTLGVISDPSGELTALHQRVASRYAGRSWVRVRCENALDKVRAYVSQLDESQPLHDQVICALFATGLTTHVLLVAGLKNPTVRRRYAEVRELLSSCGRIDFHESLLGLLGCEGMEATRAGEHLNALAGAFDAARAVLATPFTFASDISEVARPVAIDGSRDLIGRGYHREAVFWIAVSYSRCQKVLHHDAPPEMRQRFRPGFDSLLEDLRIGSFRDLRQRGEEVLSFLPELWEVAESIAEANPGIEE